MSVISSFKVPPHTVEIGGTLHMADGRTIIPRPVKVTIAADEVAEMGVTFIGDDAALTATVKKVGAY